MCAAKNTLVYGESDPCQMETQIQYENGQQTHFMIEHYMFELPITEMKATLVALPIMQTVPEKPKDLKLCLVMPADAEVGGGHIHVGAPTEMDLDDNRTLQSYLDEISCCLGLKLKRRVP